MQFEIPRIINEAPVKAHWMAQFPEDPKKAGFSFIQARRIHMRTRLGEMQRWRCCWCQCETVVEPGFCNSATIEHVTPRSEGGTNDWENLAMSCHRCNHRRGTKGVHEFMFELMVEVIERRHPDMVLTGLSKTAKRRRRLQEQVMAVIATNPGDNPYDETNPRHRIYERLIAERRMAA